MILLDTNYLIRALVEGSTEAEDVAGWIGHGTELCTSAVVWYEFLCGPLDEEGIGLVRATLGDRILPYTAHHATIAARLFNSVGRKRHLRVDAMIAAVAIAGDSTLATGNLDDFAVFENSGLKLYRSGEP